VSQLREYQVKLVEELRQSWCEGFKSPCIVAPCGAGKSVIAAEIAERTTKNGNNILFLVHRQELCEQITQTFEGWGVDMNFCKVGMVQTITRRLDKIPAPKLIITDENHHCLAKSYKKIYEFFPNALRVGITATPARLNGGGLGDINDKLILGPPVRWLIDNNYLSPFEYYSPTLADMSKLAVSRGEFAAADAERALNDRTIYGDVIGYYKRLSDGKKAVCYCTSVLHSRSMADQFKAAGIEAEHMDGNTPSYLRNWIVSNFRSGNIKILCNVDLISEGFDVPDCSASILLRPTKSLTLHVQQSMRCMRYTPGKRATIIDHVGNYVRHGLPDQEREWTLEPDPKKIKKKQSLKRADVRQCPKCFFTHELANICPKCGHVYKTERELKIDADCKLEIIKGFSLDFSSPNDCQNLRDLQIYAKNHGYKPGWAFYQAKARGIIAR
jgi:superfamily II DNA or RNA helicase